MEERTRPAAGEWRSGHMRPGYVEENAAAVPRAEKCRCDGCERTI